MTKNVLTFPEFYAHFKGTIGEHTLRKYINSGKIKSFKAGSGGKILILASEIEDFPRRLSEESA